MMQYSSLSSIQILEKLVSFNTESHRSNLPLIEFIESYLKQFSVETRRFLNKDKTKAALFATIGKGQKEGLILSGHTDVVPVEGQNWISDPYHLRIENGNAYGRGTVDMKGFIACVLAQVPVFLARSSENPIHLLFSYDEEISCLGSLDALQWIKDQRFPVMGVLVGEPTMMTMVDAHKNVSAFETIFHGTAAHSATLRKGTSAIMASGTFIAELSKLADILEQRVSPAPIHETQYSTLHVSEIKGGGATNILAKECRLIWETRSVTEQDDIFIAQYVQEMSQDIEVRILNRFGSFGSIETRKLYDVIGLKSLEQNPLRDLIAKISGKNHYEAVPYMTEGGYFQQAGFPVVVYGPGSIDQAHKSDEFIALDQLEQCDTFLQKLAEAF